MDHRPFLRDPQEPQSLQARALMRIRDAILEGEIGRASCRERV